MRLTMREIADRLDVDHSTVRKMRRAGRMPEPLNPHVRKGFLWDEEVIDRWHRSGLIGDNAVERFEILAGDLDHLSTHEAVDPNLRKLALSMATALRVDVPAGVRTAIAAVAISTNWFSKLRLDGPEELRVLRANLQILGMIRDAAN